VSIQIISVQRDYLTGQPEVNGYDEDEDTLDYRAFSFEPRAIRNSTRVHHERVLACRCDGQWYVVPTPGTDAEEWKRRFEDALDTFSERMSAQARRVAGIVDADAIEDPLELPAPRLMLPPAGGTCDGR
jgi:hypothetical protein